MQRAFLFTNSHCHEDINILINSDDYIIGVDGGVNTLEEINLEPHIIIGDFDSVNSNNKFLSKDIRKITHPPEKDYTDTELAINYAVEQQFSPLFIVNDMQQRIDHVLGVIASLRYLHKAGHKAIILGDKQLFIILDSFNLFSLPLNTTVSLLPLTDKVSGITTKGLYYPLFSEVLTSDRARGVSNLVKETDVEINVGEGELLFIVNFQEYKEISGLIKRIQ